MIPLTSLLKTAAQILLVSLVSAAVLTISYLYSQTSLFANPEISLIVWKGSSLRLEEGKAIPLGSSLAIKELSENSQAVLLMPIPRFSASEFPVLRYTIEGLWAGSQLSIFWRDKIDPGKMHIAPLTWAGDTSYAYLGKHPSWQGEIIEIGLAMGGDLRNATLIHEIALLPLTPGALLHSILSEWMGFEGIRMRSEHFIYGGIKRPILPLSGVVAVWLLLALALHFALFQRGRRSDFTWSLVYFVIGWALLDGQQWLDAWRQVQRTEALFAGKNWEQRSGAASDGWLFDLAQELRTKLPAPYRKVFLVSQEINAGNPYTALRARYHLLPHNLSPPMGWPPEPDLAVEGEYILVIKDHKDLTFDVEARQLRWKNRHLGVELVFSSPMGTLYRVANAP